MLIVLPIVWLFGLVCLSAWWVCRKVPLERTPSARLAGALVGAMLQGSAMWVGPSTLWLVWTAGPTRRARSC